jgi:hypothetical protein
MTQHCKHPSPQVQRRVARQSQKVDATHFFNLLTGPELLAAVEANLPEHRERQYPPTVTLAMFLGQALSADGSCQNAVDAAMVARLLGGLSRGSVNTAGYCQARQRLPQELVSVLTQVTGTLLDSRSPESWLWEGRPVKLVDGTTVLMPDTEENQASYPQHGSQAVGVGFPLARLVAVISLSTGAVLAGALGPHKGKGTGENGLFQALKDCFVAGDIMLADRYYCSYFLIADMQRRGVDVLFEQHGARLTDFRKGEKLGERDHRVSWLKPLRPEWMSVEEYQSHPDEMTVRELRVGKKILVTTFLHPRKTPKGKLGELFWQRWHVELDLRNIKTTLGMERLSCLSPSMCEKEMWVYFLAYNLIRVLMAESALQAGVLPRHLSFKHAVQVWTAWSQRQFLSESDEDIGKLFSIIAQIQVGKRPGRVEPRVVKRRPKPYARMDKPRHVLREEIRKCGHPQKLAA